MPAITKYRMLAMLMTGTDFAKSPNDIAFISKMRNELIHFTPKWEDTKAPKTNLETLYHNNFEKEFALNPFYPEDLMFFPYRCLSADCAEWSVKTIKNFIKDFNTTVQT